MSAQGFCVEPTDGCPELAAEAERHLGFPVRVMAFDELVAVSRYDGVWASASLLHVPIEDLTNVLSRVHAALKPKGSFWSSYKAGTAAGRDRFGRYYNRLGADGLRERFERAGRWRELVITQHTGTGYDGEATDWLWAEAVK